MKKEFVLNYIKYTKEKIYNACIFWTVHWMALYNKSTFVKY